MLWRKGSKCRGRQSNVRAEARREGWRLLVRLLWGEEEKKRAVLCFKETFP